MCTYHGVGSHQKQDIPRCACNIKGAVPTVNSIVWNFNAAYAVADSWQGVVLQLRMWAVTIIPLPQTPTLQNVRFAVLMVVTTKTVIILESDPIHFSRCLHELQRTVLSWTWDAAGSSYMLVRTYLPNYVPSHIPHSKRRTLVKLHVIRSLAFTGLFGSMVINLPVT